MFPLRERVTVKEIEDALNSLAAKGCISLYDVGGSSYFWFPTWANHQRIQTKKSKFPEPKDGEIRESTVNHRESPPESNPIQSESNPNPRESIGAAAPTSAKREYGEYGWVKLTDGQYEKLLSDLGQAELDRCIAYIDESAQSNGNKNKWKDWNLVIRKCNREGWGRRGQKETQQSGYNGSVPDYDADRSDSF